jgi:beta-fructofuranosidase
VFQEYPLKDWGGCLLRYTSVDLVNWQLEGPFLVPGAEPRYAGIPECPDLFAWNGRYYLLFGSNLMAHYRMSSSPFGPWVRPPVDVFDGAFAAVMKTAPYGPNRRIGVAFLCSRKDNTDQGCRQWAGNMVFRELVQLDDGTLGTKFVDEMVPAVGDRMDAPFEAITPGVRGSGVVVQIDAAQGFEVGAFSNLPLDLRIRCRATPSPDTAVFGLGLRGEGRFERRYDLRFDWHRRTISLADQPVPTAIDLREPLQLDIVMAGDVIDVCVSNHQCIINRCPDLKGQRLFLFCQNGGVKFDQIDIRPVK